jgi:hypothetical protein
MKFITAANVRYKAIVEDCIKSVRSLGFDIVVYDLGGLGFGKPFTVTSEQFHNEGEYENTTRRCFGIRKTRALFKPSVVKDAVTDFPNEALVWIDADTLLLKEMHLETGGYDVAVALRSKEEMEKTRKLMCNGMGGLAKYQGFHNAGFIVFQPTPLAREFVNHWEALTEKVGNDQLALNVLIETDEAAIKVLPHEYNSELQTNETILYHMKGNRKTVTITEG